MTEVVLTPTERLIASWLARQAPARAPDRIVAEIMAAVDVPARRPYGVRARNDRRIGLPALVTAAVLGLIALLAALPLLGAGSRRPAATPAAVAPGPSGFVRFVSTEFPYSAVIPSDWKVRPGDPNGDFFGYSFKGPGRFGTQGDWLHGASGWLLIYASPTSAARLEDIRPNPALTLPLWFVAVTPEASCDPRPLACVMAVTIDGAEGRLIVPSGQGYPEAWVVRDGWLFHIYVGSPGNDVDSPGDGLGIKAILAMIHLGSPADATAGSTP